VEKPGAAPVALAQAESGAVGLEELGSPWASGYPVTLRVHKMISLASNTQLAVSQLDGTATRRTGLFAR
jgi:hypothetical protein